MERRGRVLEIRKILNHKKYDIGIESDALVGEAEDAVRLEKAKQYYASCRIQGVVRGFLARCKVSELLEKFRALKVIQRVMKGKLGRIMWMREYWKSISVVKSPEALTELIKRSAMKRESASGMGAHWQEYYDPVSGAFWYLERRSRMTTWNCPIALQRNLICTWDGFIEFGGMPSDTKCRQIFDNVAEYHGHVRDCHKWFCVSCSTRNRGANFPRCTLCGNCSDENGDDGEEVLRGAIQEVQSKISAFMADAGTRQIASKKGDKFILKEQLIKLTLDKVEKDRKKKEILENPQLDEKSNLNNSKTSTTIFSTSQQSPANTAKSGKQRRKAKKGKNNLPPLAVRKSIEAEKISADWERKDRSRRVKNLKVTGCMIPLAPLFTEEGEEAPPLLYQDKESNNYAGLFRSVVESQQAKNWRETGGKAGEIERFRDPITKGIIPNRLFERVVKVKVVNDSNSINSRQLNYQEDESSDEEEENNIVDDESTIATTDGSLLTDTEKHQEELLDYMHSCGEEGAKMLVCQAFLDGQCSKIVCEKAHPGKRDSAEIKSVRLPGRTKKSQYVMCCPDYNGNVVTGCKYAGECDKYHIYIRPSTKDIILRIYPREEGEKSKLLQSGAEITGTLHNNKLQGYGVMTWVNGATYSGNWSDDLREGFGIYRTPFGTEYSGGWIKGKRDGFGCYINSIGEEYVGEWKDGKMEGNGKLTSPNGDSYEGRFMNHKYHGVGVFSKSNGDRFMGYCQEGMACGLGIMALGIGEKYKGYFDRNFRHGKGVCAYPNGSRYAGQWYRGVPHGFGVFVAPNGEKYVGEFRGGKKHGNGRYFFLDGSFYDGEFHKNKAQGMGCYFFASGDKYSGLWKNDRRNGIGTYKYSNGSVYTGNWVDNSIQGKGKFDWAYGAYYRGEFHANKKEGKGIFTWPNGNIYKGMFKSESLCGVGEMKYASGHTYTGSWENNKKHGKGVFKYANGAVYTGDWIADVRQGKGKIQFLPGTFIEEYYDGEWFNDEKHGQGTYSYRKDEGTVYTGSWKRNKRDGVGKISYIDGSYYRGDFLEEKMHGTGIYIGVDGSQYDGEWEDNMRQGLGTLLGADGSIYRGEFHKNMKHGKGKVQFQDGNFFEGEWEGNVVRGEGQTSKYTLMLGQTSRGGPEEVTVRCFSY